MKKEKAKTMVRIKAAARSCTPFVGIAVIIALCQEPKLFLSVLFIPLAIAIPLIIWSTKKINDAVTAKRLIDLKCVVTYRLSLVLIAAGACFSLMLEAAGSHG